MGQSTKRVEFPAKTKMKIAMRAAYRCSIPECNRTTVGPGPSPDEPALTGVAAHIYPASANGPRSSMQLTVEEVRSPTNAIWLCSDHARLVDTHRGEQYPPSLLISYKALHEARIARELNGIITPMGWFQQLLVDVSPVFKSFEKLRFGKVTLIQGDNGSGKTAICQWLCAISGPEFLKRWLWRRPGDKALRYHVTYYGPEEHRTTVEIDELGNYRYVIEGKVVPLVPYALKCVYLSSYNHPGSRSKIEDFEFLAKHLGLSSETVQNVIPFFNQDPPGSVRSLEIQKVDGRKELFACAGGHIPYQRFSELSHGQMARVMIDLAISVARFYSQFVPTILLLDGGIHSLDLDWLEQYANYLLDPKIMFQTVIVLPTGCRELQRLRWIGWEYVRLDGKSNEVSIVQDGG